MEPLVLNTWIIGTEIGGLRVAVSKLYDEIPWQTMLVLPSGVQSTTALGRITAVLCGDDGQLNSVPVEFRRHDDPARLTSFNISPYLQAPWNTTEFSIDYSGNWTGRYTAIESGERRSIASDAPHRILVVKHSSSQRQAAELVDITTDEIAALSRALISMNEN